MISLTIPVKITGIQAYFERSRLLNVPSFLLITQKMILNGSIWFFRLQFKIVNNLPNL